MKSLDVIIKGYDSVSIGFISTTGLTLASCSMFIRSMPVIVLSGVCLLIVILLRIISTSVVACKDIIIVDIKINDTHRDFLELVNIFGVFR